MWTVVNSRIQQAELFLGGFPIEWPVQTWITLYGGVKRGRDTGIIHAAPPTTLKLMTNPSVVGVWVKINEHASNYQLPEELKIKYIQSVFSSLGVYHWGSFVALERIWYIAGQIDCYSAKLTTAAIDATLYMTTSEH